MPRIPLYNQGQGPAVQLATGSLSRQASMGAFTAPGKALAGFGEKAADIAFQFGMAEKKAEADRIYNEELANISAQVDDLIMNPKSRTVIDFNSEANEFRTKALSNIQARPDLTKSQKTAIATNLGSYIDRKVSVGRAQVFTKQTADRKVAALDSLDAHMNDWVKSPSTRNETMASIRNILTSSQEQGLNLGRTEDSIMYELEARQIQSESINDSLSLDYHKSKREQILKGEGEYARFGSAERERLAAAVGKRVNYLETDALVESQTNIKSAAILMSNSTNDDDRNRYKELALSEVNNLEKLGRPDLAAQSMDTIIAADAALDFRDDFAFADSKTLSAALKSAREELLDVKDLEDAIGAQAKYDAVIEMSQQMAKAQQEDPAAYVASTYERLNGKVPTIAQNIAKQREMGLSDAQIKPLTGQQTDVILEQINTAAAEGDPNALKNVFKSIDGAEGNEALITKQLKENGLTLAAMYVASNPDMAINKTLLKSSVAGGITISVPKAKRDMAEAAVRENESVRNHLASMGGALLQDFAGNAMLSLGVDNAYMDAARKEHIDMITDLAIYLMQEDGKFFGEGSVADTGNFEQYATMAASILNQKYDYVKVNNSTLRLKNHTAQNFSEEIVGGIEITIKDINEDDIFYESSRFEEGTREYEMEKAKYIERLKDNYGAISNNGELAATITDEVGGSVFVKVVGEDGQMEIQPLTVLFSDAVATNEAKGTPRLDALQQKKQNLGRQLRDLGPGKQEEKAALKSQIEDINQQINDLRRTIAGRK